MSDRLTTLLHERVHGVPTTLRPATDIRRRAEQHRRARRAATAAGAGLLTVAIVLGVGLADGRKRAVEPPVKEPARGVAVLLIADELPAAGPMTYQVTTGQREHLELAASCPRDMASLGAQTIWQRTFVGQALDREPDEKIQDATQVVAEFASPDAAATAFATIDGWFQACKGTNKEPIRQPAMTHAGGRALFVEILVDRPGYRLNHESTTYAINGAAITVVSVSHYAVNASGHPDTRGRQETLAMFALQRLAGTRTITENAVPSAFRFAEEAKLHPSRITALDQPWAFLACRRTDRPYRSADVELRTGMLTLDGGGAPHQLAVYPDEETAKAAAQYIRADISSCAKWTVEAGSRTDDVVLASLPRSDGGVVAVAVARWGNSVFFPVVGESDLIAKPAALTQLEDALTANRPLVCRVAQGCS